MIKDSGRNVFEELVEGAGALKAARQGKATLRTTEVTVKPDPAISPHEIRALRERLGLSQGLFATRLRTKVSTVQNWEQGRYAPKRESVLLLRLVEQDPEVLDKLEAIE